MDIRKIINDRLLILDGATGTMLQKSGFSGNYDSLCLTNPDAVAHVHRLYLEAGADIIETNTFSSQRISQAEYGLEDKIAELNQRAAQIARREADRMTALTPSKPRFVAGSVGPTNQACSISPDIDNPALRSIDYDTMSAAYEEQMTALILGGVDLLLIETIFDSLNAKAAIHAAEKAFAATSRRVPLMLSITIADNAGRVLSGQTIEAFVTSVSHADIFSIGLNCSFGAQQMKPFLRQLSNITPTYISAYPNAGLPNEMGEYDQKPEEMARYVEEFISERLVNIVGGCCGTTPEHIRCLAALAEKQETAPRQRPQDNKPSFALAGQDLFSPQQGTFINVGERCNVAGSKKFLRLISEKSYDEAIQIAKKQVEDGAMILDVNMDDSMLDTREEMVNFLNLMGSDPEIARIPWMVDSSRFEVIEAALKCIQGKAIVNSLSLKEGKEEFLRKASIVHNLGASLVVMAFDEQGQATTLSRRIEICQRAYRLLTERIHFPSTDIIFDPNVLTVATGMKEHDRYAVDFIEATRWIHANLPGAKVSGGISNLSFAFRGNNYLREAMHAVFLYHAIKAGLDMAIINPASKVMYQDIPSQLLEALEDVILCRRDDATERLLEISTQQVTPESSQQSSSDSQTTLPSVSERLITALQRGNEQNLKTDIDEALLQYPSPTAIIEGPLMEGMSLVGRLFGEGKMFLPQVIKTARTMKSAITLLEPHIRQSQDTHSNTAQRPRYLLATVKGDVHDIGKNIAGVVLACNNFEVIDLGVMTPAEDIVRTAIEKKVSFIGLSGLITPSLGEMCNTASLLKAAGISVPLFISGATTSEAHTAIKIAPLYDGPVFHLKDASQNPVIATALMSAERETIIEANRLHQQKIREDYQASKDNQKNEAVKAKPSVVNQANHVVTRPSYLGNRDYTISIRDVRPYINWVHFYNTWKIKSNEEANRILDTIQDKYTMLARIGFFPASSASESITFVKEKKCDCGHSHKQEVTLRVPQQLASYVKAKGQEDYVGTFAITISPDFIQATRGDIMLQSIADRLAEATSEYLHEKVRKELWAFAKDENLTIDQLFKGHYTGIRPAVGYSALPDQQQIFNLDKLIDYTSAGITLTENGAMYPPSSVSGIYIANPEAKYF